MSAYLQGRNRAAHFYRNFARQWDYDAGNDIELAEVRQVRILPLMDYYADRDDLETEPGFSYLIQTDHTTIIFDLGLNHKNEATPPLLRNMERLGVVPSDIDFVVLSHAHSDHLGGLRNKQEQRAILRETEDPLAGIPVITTRLLNVTDGLSTVVERPGELARGIGTTGPLPVQLFMSGYTTEQSLVVRVARKGLVLIIGCGHPGVRRIVDAAERVFREPVYGIIGGLHYPVTQDRRSTGWFKPQKLFGNPEPPWRPISKETVRHTIRELKQKGIQRISISPHDSCNWSLNEFAQAFKEQYEPLLVGREIRIG